MSKVTVSLNLWINGVFQIFNRVFRELNRLTEIFRSIFNWRFRYYFEPHMDLDLPDKFHLCFQMSRGVAWFNIQEWWIYLRLSSISRELSFLVIDDLSFLDKQQTKQLGKIDKVNSDLCRALKCPLQENQFNILKTHDRIFVIFWQMFSNNSREDSWSNGTSVQICRRWRNYNSFPCNWNKLHCNDPPMCCPSSIITLPFYPVLTVVLPLPTSSLYSTITFMCTLY